MKTIAQQLNVKEFPFTIKDSQGNVIYFENSAGTWSKREFDAQGHMIYYEYFTGYWVKKEFDSQGNEIYFEDSYGKINDNRPKKVIYFENFTGEINDNRPKKVILSMSEIAQRLNIPVDQLQIKK